MTRISSEQQAFLDDLIRFLRIPSVSTDPEHEPDIFSAAVYLMAQLEQAGLEQVHLIEGEGNPLVYGEWLHAEGAPTILFYGHYDVQPPDPLEEWVSPPFEPRIENDNIYARGAADDKGLTLILIKAVERLMKRDGRLPVNVRFLIEGEEETSGRHIEEYVTQWPQQVAADAVVISDTEMFAPETPTLMTGLRGIVYGEIHVQTATQDLHSGSFGGAVPNALQAIAEILCALKDRDGVIQIPGLYDSVKPPSEAERESWSRLPFNEATFASKDAGVKELTGEPGVPVFERLWARPTFEVHGIMGGFTGEGTKTVIPARAAAKVSLRLVPDQVPSEVIEQVQKAVLAACPRGATAEFRALQSAPPSMVDTESPYLKIAAQAMEQVFGNPTVFIRCGGSIPIAGLFARRLGIPSVLMGFGLPDDNLHAPNEKLYLPNFFQGIDAVERYLLMLGELKG
jgi:acetylornithine deacetylase/succinyl-diaminopimelate desuccinylase-like protein